MQITENPHRISSYLHKVQNQVISLGKHPAVITLKKRNGHIITNIRESASLWLIRKGVDCDKDKAHGGTDNTSWCGWLHHGSFHNYSINLHLHVFSLRISTNKKQNKYIKILNTWIRQQTWREKNPKVENGWLQQLRRRPEVLDNESRRERNASECYGNRDRI